MDAQIPSSNPLADAFGLRDAPALTTRKLHKSKLTVTELRSDAPNFGFTKTIPYDDAYLISLQIRASPDHDQFFKGRYVKPTNFVAGVTSIYDLRREPIAEHRDPFHFLAFYLPRSALLDVAAEAHAAPLGDLRHQPGVAVNDAVVRYLLSSLLAAVAKPHEANAIFVDHVASALCAHVAQTYGGMRNMQRARRGGLAPWQERRAKELLSANLGGEIPLDRLASQCGLSPRHFARAFRQSIGVPPHRWLLQRRVERAREMLRSQARSLAEVALACGFADQSHFTRVFNAMVGVSPGLWRRMQSGRSP